MQIRQTMRIATLQKKNPEFKHVLLLHSHRKIIQSLLSDMHVVEEDANYVYHATWTDSRDNISYYLTIVTLLVLNTFPISKNNNNLVMT